MSYQITANCIGCQRCLAACPTGAIATNGTTVWIDAGRCDRCQDSYGVAQCWSVCPTNDGCVPLSDERAIAATGQDYWESWFDTYTRLVRRLQPPAATRYWHGWFDRYADTVRQLQGGRSPQG